VYLITSLYNFFLLVWSFGKNSSILFINNLISKVENHLPFLSGRIHRRSSWSEKSWPFAQPASDSPARPEARFRWRKVPAPGHSTRTSWVCCGRDRSWQPTARQTGNRGSSHRPGDTGLQEETVNRATGFLLIVLFRMGIGYSCRSRRVYAASVIWWVPDCHVIECWTLWAWLGLAGRVWKVRFAGWISTKTDTF